MFSGSGNLMALSQRLHHEPGSEKFKMAAVKPDIHSTLFSLYTLQTSPWSANQEFMSATSNSTCMQSYFHKNDVCNVMALCGCTRENNAIDQMNETSACKLYRSQRSRYYMTSNRSHDVIALWPNYVITVSIYEIRMKRRRCLLIIYFHKNQFNSIALVQLAICQMTDGNNFTAKSAMYTFCLSTNLTPQSDVWV